MSTGIKLRHVHMLSDDMRSSEKIYEFTNHASTYPVC